MTAYLYIIGHPTGARKIGVTTRPEERLKHIQSCNPCHISADALFEIDDNHRFVLEHAVHKTVRDRHIGYEWFQITRGDSVRAVRKCAEELGLEIQHVSFKAGLSYRDPISPDPESRAGFPKYLGRHDNGQVA